jgi:hypothetical protein
MTYKARAADLQHRERRQHGYTAATTIGERFPGIGELSLELRFTQAGGSPLLSPYRQIYTADMQAFFELQCPSRDCVGGGFDLQQAVLNATRSRDGISQGLLRCHGDSTRNGTCSVEMTFKAVAVTG